MLTRFLRSSVNRHRGSLGATSQALKSCVTVDHHVLVAPEPAASCGQSMPPGFGAPQVPHHGGPRRTHPRWRRTRTDRHGPGMASCFNPEAAVQGGWPLNRLSLGDRFTLSHSLASQQRQRPRATRVSLLSAIEARMRPLCAEIQGAIGQVADLAGWQAMSQMGRKGSIDT